MAALRGRAGRGWQPFGGDTKREGRGQSKKVSTGEGKQHRQARSDWIHTDLPGSTGCQKTTVGCGSLAKASSLNPGPRQCWLSAQHMVLFSAGNPGRTSKDLPGNTQSSTALKALLCLQETALLASLSSWQARAIPIQSSIPHVLPQRCCRAPDTTRDTPTSPPHWPPTAELQLLHCLEAQH